MPNRNLDVIYVPNTPRRSPRFALIHENNSTTKPNATKKSSIQSRTPTVNPESKPTENFSIQSRTPTSLRRSARFSNPKDIMTEQKIQVKMSIPSRDSERVIKGKTREGSGDEGIVVGVGVKWKRKSPRLNDEVSSLIQRSARLSDHKVLENEQKIEAKTSFSFCDSEGVKKGKTKEGSGNEGIAVGVGVKRKSPRLNVKVPSLRRQSPRFFDHKVLLNEQKIEVITSFPSHDSARVKKGKTKEVSGDEGIAVGVGVKRKLPRLNDKVPSLRRRSARFSDHKVLANEQKIEVKTSKFPSNNSTRVEKGKSKEGSGGEEIVVEVGVKRKIKCIGDEIVEGRKKEQVEGVVEGKRMCGGDEIVEEQRKEPAEGGAKGKGKGKGKRKHGGCEIAEGWTEEQELALRIAYSTVKPTPHFWKNVSKLVPGKSTQDCFDRIHADYPSPSSSPSRSRAKTIKEASPPVLKPVKNMVQHEKYVKQLQRRNRKRKATSTQVGQGKGIHKLDVKAANVALRAIAKDAINTFQQSQAIDDFNNEDNDDDSDDDIR